MMLFPSLFVVFTLLTTIAGQSINRSFCFTAFSNVSGSAALPWSTQSFVTLSLMPSSINGLYTVTNATGYRIINTRGQTYNQSINGVASVGSYHSNDNLISINQPYLIDSHSFALTFASAVESVYFTSTDASILFKNESNQIVEDDLPYNDGVINQITSSFSMSSTCPILPVFTISAASLSAFNNRQSIPFCYSFSGGPGDGSPDQTLWTVTASGTLTISGLAGTNPSTPGAQSFIVLGISGTRTYHDEFGNMNVVNRFVGVSPSSAAFSTRYPNFDARGLKVMFDSSLFYWNGNASTRVATLLVDSANMFNELIGETGSIKNVVGNLDVQIPGDTQPLQCGFEDGSLASYQFCYEVTNASAPWSVMTYGQFTATGPVIRRDVPALTMQGMTGIRVVTNSSGNYTQNIIKLVYVNGVNASSGSGILNDNLVFVDASNPLDYYGFVATLSTPAIFPATGVSPNGDINLSAGSTKWYEWPVAAGDMEGVESQLAQGYFRYNNTLTVGEDFFPCRTGVSIPKMKKFYFCYTITTSDYTVQASGLILTYGADVPFQGRTGYSIANITGTRSFTRGGVTTYSTILSSNSESWGAINNTYSKILYPTAPYLDSLGVVVHVDDRAQTPLGTLIGEHVIDLSMMQGSNITELAFTTGGSFTSGLGWMTITETESQSACRVVEPSNSASGLVSSVFITMIAMLLVVLMQ